MSSCSNIFAISLFERIGIVCPGGSLTGAFVILFRSGAGCSASNLRSASATRSRSVEPRFTAAILARFTRSSGRSKVERINMTICFPALHCGVSLPACQRQLLQARIDACQCFIYDLWRRYVGHRLAGCSSRDLTDNIGSFMPTTKSLSVGRHPFPQPLGPLSYAVAPAPRTII